MLQLLITLGFITLFVYHEPTKRWVNHNPAVFWVAFAASIVLLIAMACCTSVRRQAPMNYIFLLLFTIAEAFVLGTAASRYQPDAVIIIIK